MQQASIAARQNAEQALGDYKTKMTNHARDWVAKNRANYATDAALQAAWEAAWKQDGAKDIQAVGVSLASYQAAVKSELRVAAGTTPGGPQAEQAAIDAKTGEIKDRGADGTWSDGILDGLATDADTAVSGETVEQRAAALETPEAIEAYDAAKTELARLETAQDTELANCDSKWEQQETRDSYSDDLAKARQDVDTTGIAATEAINHEATLTLASNVLDDAKAGVISATDQDPKLRQADLPDAQSALNAAEQQYDDVVAGTIKTPLELEHFTPTQVDPALQEVFSNHPGLLDHPELANPLAMQAEGLKVKPELDAHLAIFDPNDKNLPPWLKTLGQEDKVTAAFIMALWSGEEMAGQSLPVPKGKLEEALASEDPLTFALLKYAGGSLPDATPAEWEKFDTPESAANHARDLAGKTLGETMLTNPAKFQRLQALMAASGDVRADFVQAEVDVLLQGRTPEQAVEAIKNASVNEETPTTPEQKALKIIFDNRHAAFTPDQQAQIWNQAGDPYFSTDDFAAQAAYLKEKYPNDTVTIGYWLKEMGRFAPVPAAGNLLDGTKNTFRGTEIFQREGINGAFSSALQIVVDRAPGHADDIATWALDEGGHNAVENLRAPREDGTGAGLAEAIMRQVRGSDTIPQNVIDFHESKHNEGMQNASEALGKKEGAAQYAYFNSDAKTVVQEMFDNLLSKDKNGNYGKQHDFTNVTGNDRINLLGEALQLQPDNPDAEPGEARYTVRDKNGNLTENGKKIDQLEKWIIETGGQNALVTFVPSIYASKEGMQCLYLVKVGNDGNNDGTIAGDEEDFIVDGSMADEAAAGQNVPWEYDDLQDFQEDNEYDDEGRLYLSGRDDMLLKVKDGHADVNLDGIEAAITTTWEHVRRGLDIGLGVVGAVAGVALIVGTGGLAAAAIVTAGAAYGLARTVETGVEMVDRGQSLNPFNPDAEGAWLGFIDPQAGGLWLGGIASASGLATLRPAALASSIARGGGGIRTADQALVDGAGLHASQFSRNVGTNLFGKNGLQLNVYQLKVGQGPVLLGNIAKYSGGALVGGQAWSLTHAAVTGQLDLTAMGLHSAIWDIALLGTGIGSMGAGGMASRNRRTPSEQRVDPVSGDEGRRQQQPYSRPMPIREVRESDADGIFQPTGRMVPVDDGGLVPPIARDVEAGDGTGIDDPIILPTPARYATQRPDVDAPGYQPRPEPQPRGSIENLEHHAIEGTLTYEMVEVAEYLAPLTSEQATHYLAVVDALDGRAPVEPIAPVGQHPPRTLAAAPVRLALPPGRTAPPTRMFVVDGAGTVTSQPTSDVVKQMIGDFRQAITAKLSKNSSNVALARSTVPGVPTWIFSHRNIFKPGQIPDGYEVSLGPTDVFETTPSVDSTGRIIRRAYDTENKILDNIASRLGDDRSARGTIFLFTERVPCESCAGVIRQFQERYPNINLVVADNDDVILSEAPTVPKPTKALG